MVEALQQRSIYSRYNIEQDRAILYGLCRFRSVTVCTSEERLLSSDMLRILAYPVTP